MELPISLQTEYKLVFADVCAFDTDMQHCPNCGAGELKIIAAILKRLVIDTILSHLGLDAQPPRVWVGETGEAWVL
ncbi:MAG: hypothetical protein FJY26_03530 [Betaproteobacteria bacterium]|nr:hypothetical protein [Betaproteobacteria bacterium]